MFRVTPAIKNILIINVAIFLIDYAVVNGLINDFLTLQFVLSDNFIFVQLIGYMWIHASFRHIFSNMIILFFLGPMLEEHLGPKRFMQFYLIVGLGAGMLYAIINFVQIYPDIISANEYIANPSSEAFSEYVFEGLPKHIKSNNGEYLSVIMENYRNNPDDKQIEAETVKLASDVYLSAKQGYSGGMLGASGAVFGVLMAIGLLFPDRIINIYFVLPVKIKYVVIALGAYTIYNQLNQREGDYVSHLTHLTGMIVAVILLRIWKNKI